MKDGGPAFPVNYSNEADGPTIMPAEGMSLRDWFAGQATDIDIAPYVARGIDRASARFRFAEDMLKAREGSND